MNGMDMDTQFGLMLMKERNLFAHWIALALWMSTTKCLHTRQEPENP